MKSWHQIEKEQRYWYWSMGEWVAQALREAGYAVRS